MVGEKFQNVGEKYTQGLAHGAHEIVRLERTCAVRVVSRLVSCGDGDGEA
jgi:hypothetical protein